MSDLNIDILKELGKFTKEIRHNVSKMINVGIDITDIIDFIENSIFKEGYLPSFPAMVSKNDMAAHYTIFDEGYILQKGDVIKVDFGISKEGYISDNAFTVEVGSNDHAELIKTAKACLDKALEVVDIDIPMKEIGSAVSKVAKDKGFNTIHNLSGHQIGRHDLHYGLSIPNTDNGDSSKVGPNMLLAIEPFVTYGKPLIKACGPSNILHLKKDAPVRDPIAMKLLKHIREHFPKLPFSKRWLVDSVLKNNLNSNTSFTGFEKRKVLYGIKILKKYGILYEYDELGTIDGEIVAQFEDSVMFEGKIKTIITRL